MPVTRKPIISNARDARDPVPFQRDLRTWALRDNTLLNTKFFSGLPSYDWQNPAPVADNAWIRTWVYSTPTLVYVTVPFPKNQYDWPLPTPPNRQPDLRTWNWNYNQNLIGQDQLPTGEQSYELAPRAYPRLDQQRTWTWQYNLNLIGQDKLPTGDQSYELTQRPYPYPNDLRIWTWQYNLNLIGQDSMLVGDQLTERPPPINWYRSWELNLQQTTLSAIQLPFNQFDWPLYRDFQRVTPSWTWQYNLNLIGQDSMLVGDQLTERPPPVNWYRSWELNLQQTTLGALKPFAQTDWPLGRDYQRSPPSWTWQYNLNLIGQDQLPTGEQSFELTQRPYPYPSDLRIWVWNYNRNLIGKDKLPPGELVYDLSPKGPSQPDRFWSWSYNLNLIGQDKLPTGKTIYDLTPKGYPPLTPSWAWYYNLNLIGQDAMLVGDQLTDRPPPLNWYRSWELDLLQTTLSIIQRPFNQFDWPLYRDYQRSPPSWSWQYNLNLIGQDQLPVGELVYERPPVPPWYRTWEFNLLQSTLFSAAPFNQFDWPVPKAYPPTTPSWTWWFNLNLIGQDRLTTGKIIYDLPPSGYLPTADRRTWYWSYNLNLIGQDRLTVGKSIYDLAPFGYIYPVQQRTWTWQYNYNLIGQDKVPGKVIYDLTPLGYPRQDQQRTWTWQYNLNLIGQDAMLVGEQFSERPPPVQWYRTWEQNLLQNTLTPVVVGPLGVLFNQYDWPNPRDYQRITPPSWTWTYNLNLIAQDKLVTGKIIYDLVPGFPPQVPSWAWWYNLNLIAQDLMVPGQITYELPPRPYPLVANDILPVATVIAIIPPPPPAPPVEIGPPRGRPRPIYDPWFEIEFIQMWLETDDD